MTKAAPLGIRLFMEGVEIPCISAQVTLQPDGPAVAAIQVVPSDAALTLLPRTLVHLFYLDYAAFEEYAPEDIDVEETNAAQNDAGRFVAPDAYYKLMFSGQVIGLNYAKTPVSRQLVLQCMDLSIYWDTCYQWFADYSVGGSALEDKSHNFVGAGQGLFDNVAGGHKWVIGNLLNSKPRTPEYRDTPGLLGGLIHLLEAIGGIRYRKGTGSLNFEGYNGVNDFFTIGELRFNLLGMLGAVQGDKTSTRLYASKAFRSWLRNGMTSQGNLISFRDILNQVNRYIFHNLYPNPCARYVAPTSREAYKTVTVQATTYHQSSVGTSMKAAFEELNAKLQSARGYFEGAIEASRTGTLVPVASQRAIVNFETKVDIGQAVTDGRLTLLDARDNARSVDLAAESLSTDDSKAVQQSIKQVRTLIDEGLTKLALSVLSTADTAAVAIGETQSLSAVIQKTTEALDYTEQAINEINKLLGKATRGRKRVNKKINIEGGGFLFTQLVLPETFFVPPPRCNVIFPDQYYQLSYSRNFMREVTRLSLKGGLGLIGGGRGANLLGRHYFAPKIEDAEGKNLLVTEQYGGRILLPHEVHSGITPKFEHVTDGHRWGVKAAGANKSIEKVGYLQRLANFNFFLHRWSSRQINLAGIFLPRLVLGFPAVVMDRGVPPPHVLEAIQKELGRPLLPTQFLGKIVGLTHSIDQSGGTTQVAMTQCRTHRAYDDEFLGLLVKEVRSPGAQWTEKVEPANIGLLRTGRQNGYVRMLNYYQFNELKAGIKIPEFGAKVTKVKAKGEYEMPVSQAQQWGISTANSQPGTEITEGAPDSVVRPFESEIQVQAGPGLEIVETGSEAPTIAEEVVILPNVLEVTLQKAPGPSRSVDVAIEDLLTPGWYSDVWRRDKIGKEVYQQLIGTWAITDDVDINTESQNALLQRWKTEIADTTPSGETELASADDQAELTVGELVTGSVEAAVDSLALLYGYLQSQGGNVHEFIERYTYRSIANLPEVLGSQNLQFNDRGLVEDPETMTEGFHSRAFGPYNVDGKDAMKALFPGVSSAKIRTLTRPSLTNSRNRGFVKPDLDPRGEAQRRVLAYRAELQVSRGLSGA